MKKDSVDSLKELGRTATLYIYDKPEKSVLETFDNQFPKNNYVVNYKFDEFSSLCPKTGQPDFATIIISYIPNKKCIETKSLKLYFLRFRQYGAFMETIVNQILEDCFSSCNPQQMKVIGVFNPRGGTHIKVVVERKSS